MSSFLQIGVFFLGGVLMVWANINNLKFILPIDGTLTAITSLGQSGPRSNENEEVLYFIQTSRAGNSPSDTV